MSSARIRRKLGFLAGAEPSTDAAEAPAANADLAARGEKMTFEMTGGLKRTKIGMI